MKPIREFKGYSAFFDEADDTVSFVSGRLNSGYGGNDGEAEFQAPRDAAEAQKKSELQSLLLMASLMLGGREAVNGA